VTQSGAVRRADIHEVAGMLGVSAVGVSRHPRVDLDDALWDDPDLPPGPGTIYALSMTDVPALAAWWEALRIAEVIEVSSARVRPGAAARAWRAEQAPPLELAELVTGAFIAESVVQDAARPVPAFGRAIAMMTVNLLMLALDPDLDDEESAGFATLLRPRALDVMERLADVDLVERDADGYVVPPALLLTVARGTMLAMSLVARLADIDTE